MSAAIQLSLSTVKFLVGDVELQKEAMCWADAAAACAGKPLPRLIPVLENTSQPELEEALWFCIRSDGTLFRPLLSLDCLVRSASPT